MGGRDRRVTNGLWSHPTEVAMARPCGCRLFGHLLVRHIAGACTLARWVIADISLAALLIRASQSKCLDKEFYSDLLRSTSRCRCLIAMQSIKPLDAQLQCLTDRDHSLFTVYKVKVKALAQYGKSMTISKVGKTVTLTVNFNS